MSLLRANPKRAGLGLPAAVLLCAAAFAAGASMPAELSGDGSAAERKRESLRVLCQQPGNQRARLELALAELALGREPDRLLPAFVELARAATDPDVREPAALVGALLCLRGEDPETAFELLEPVFLNTERAEAFARAGRMLERAVDRRPELARARPALTSQIESGRSAWADLPSKEFEDAPRRHLVRSIVTWPLRAGIVAYRFLVRPAIGQRCSLTPSCSQYFLLSAERHGLLALPMQADRFVREPSVIAAGRRPLRSGGRLRFADPLDDHDFWMRGHPPARLK